MPFSLTEPGRQERLDEIPSHRRAHRPATRANNVHVIVLDPLPSGEVVVNQPGADAWKVGTDRRAHAATADRDAAFHLSLCHRPGEWDDKIRIVVAWCQTMSTKIDHFMSNRAELGDQLLLQTKPTVIGGNSHTHAVLLGGGP